MSNLRKAVADALVAYDGSIIDEGDIEVLNDAASECIASIRLAMEAEEPPVNLNNPIAQLQERAQQSERPMPIYSFRLVGGESHAPVFDCTCDSEDIVCSAKASNKQTAKRRAAAKVLEALIRGDEGP